MIIAPWTLADQSHAGVSQTLSPPSSATVAATHKMSARIKTIVPLYTCTNDQLASFSQPLQLPLIAYGCVVWTGGLVDWWTDGLMDWWTGGLMDLKAEPARHLLLRLPPAHSLMAFSSQSLNL